MEWTAHIEDPDGGYYVVNIRRDGQFVKRVGVVTGDQGEMADAADPMLRRDGWQPAGGDEAFWWGSPSGNMFDGPWRARIERT